MLKSTGFRLPAKLTSVLPLRSHTLFAPHLRLHSFTSCGCLVWDAGSRKPSAWILPNQAFCRREHFSDQEKSGSRPHPLNLSRPGSSRTERHFIRELPVGLKLLDLGLTSLQTTTDPHVFRA